ncbi:acyltransferase family protein [Vibrio olivae]
MNKRNIKVDTLRGLACILLVAFHVIGSDASNGLRVDTGWYREINDTFAYIRMPLFTFISGVVYAYRPFNGDFGRFLSGKFKRVLVPMLTLGTLFAIVQSATPGTNGGDFNWKLCILFQWHTFGLLKRFSSFLRLSLYWSICACSLNQ